MMRRIAVLMGLTGIASLAAAGPVNPPPGPISSTYKTLDQVSPGTPIDRLPAGGGAQHMITLPGRYVFTSDITITNNEKGLLVNFAVMPPNSRVVIEMNGYSLIGGAGAMDGIVALSLQPLGGDLVIHDGAIRDFDRDGLVCDRLGNPLINELVIGPVGGDGVRLVSPKGIDVDTCRMQQCGGSGLVVQGDLTVTTGRLEIRGAVVVDAGGDGLSLTNCGSACVSDASVLTCGGNGIAAVLNGNTVIGDLRLEGVTISQCGTDGVVVAGSGWRQVSGVKIVLDRETGRGMYIESAAVSLEEVSASGCGGDAVKINQTSHGGAMSIISKISARSCGGSGVVVEGAAECRISDSSALDCGGDGFGVSPSTAPPGGNNVNWSFGGESLTASGNGGSGFKISAITMRFAKCVATDSGDSGYRCSSPPGVPHRVAWNFAQCVAGGNHTDGWNVGMPAQGGSSTFISCEASQNTRDGLKTFFETGDIPTQAQFANLIDSNCSGNGEDGFDFEDCRVQMRGCTSSGNEQDGIALREGISQLETRLRSLGLLECRVSNNKRIAVAVLLASAHTCERTVVSGGGGGTVPSSLIVLDRVDNVSVRDSDASGGSHHGIEAIGCGTVTVRGTVVVGMAGDGLRVTGSTTVQGSLTVSGGSLRSCGGNGLAATGLSSVSITDSDVEDNSVSGASVSGTVRVSVRDSFSNRNGGDGWNMLAALDVNMDGCVANGNGAGGGAGLPPGHGTLLTNCSQVRITGSTFTGNTADGLNVGINEVLPFATLHVSRCDASANAGSGLKVLNTAAVGNQGWKAGHLQDNSCGGNAAFGIWCENVTAMSVSRNSCAGNGGAIALITSTGNLVDSNRCTAGPLGGIFVPVPGNTVGPIVDEMTIGSNCNPSANVMH